MKYTFPQSYNWHAHNRKDWAKRPLLVVKWLHENVSPCMFDDFRHSGFSTVAMFKEWRSNDDGKTWKVRLHGMNPAITVELTDYYAPIFLLKWS